MRRLFLNRFIITLIISLFSYLPVAYSGDLLKMVVIEVDTLQSVNQLQTLGLDIAAIRHRNSGKVYKGESDQGPFDVEAVISDTDQRTLKKHGFGWRDFVPKPIPAPQASARDSQGVEVQETVYHSFDEPVLGIKDQLMDIENSYPDIIKIATIGKSRQKRPILAVRITKTQKTGRYIRKPKVLFHATTHAREWISTQVGMRLIRYLTDNYGKDDRITSLLDETEVWVVPVVNPDGYEYTFTDERLWRKNLHDVNRDGQITTADGVDLNRNYDSGFFGLDEEGATNDPTDNTYRGWGPASEPETRALVRLIRLKKFKYSVSYHSYGNLILYPIGWQVNTPSLDDPIFIAQSGTDDNPAIHDSINNIGYDPGVAADLYITNGDYTEWAYNVANIPSYTVELTDGYGFEFPDDEAMVQKVFEDNLEFALSLAESAKDPAHPVSPVGMEAENIYHTPVTASSGKNQMIEILMRNDQAASLIYKVNNRWRRAEFIEKLGETYNTKTGVYYSRYVATIEGQSTGSVQRYYIFSPDGRMGPYTYTAGTVTENPILIMAAEDYSGEFPTYVDQSAPNYLEFYTQALDANGYGYDVWDIDQQGIPDYQEVLSHYKTVIWYSGDDYAPTVPLGVDLTLEAETINVRDYLNYSDGKILVTGQDASALATVFGRYSDDFYQYYLGANTNIDSGGMDDSVALPVIGLTGDPVFDGLEFNLNGSDSADNQTNADLLIAHPDNGFYSPDIAAGYKLPGGEPFAPHTGDYYVYSQQSSASYQRLGGRFRLPAGSPKLSFWASYIIEADWDYFFVEVCAPRTDFCTTVPEGINRVSLSDTSTGQSCLSGITGLHPALAKYMDADCNPNGTTGSWNAITGNSAGWRFHEYDLSPIAGTTADIYITYMTDWGTNLNGVFVDDIALTGFPDQGFETNQNNWASSVAPGTANTNPWLVTGDLMIPSGSVIRNEDTIYMGFGFEAVDTAENRNLLMNRIINYLNP